MTENITEPALLWAPEERVAQASAMSHFMREVSRHFNVDVTDYDALHRWSIESPDSFYSLLWDFLGIKGSKESSPAFLTVIFVKRRSILAQGLTMPKTCCKILITALPLFRTGMMVPGAR